MSSRLAVTVSSFYPLSWPPTGNFLSAPSPIPLLSILIHSLHNLFIILIFSLSCLLSPPFIPLPHFSHGNGSEPKLTAHKRFTFSHYMCQRLWIIRAMAGVVFCLRLPWCPCMLSMQRTFNVQLSCALILLFYSTLFILFFTLNLPHFSTEFYLFPIDFSPIDNPILNQSYLHGITHCSIYIHPLSSSPWSLPSLTVTFFFLHCTRPLIFSHAIRFLVPPGHCRH